MTSGVLTDADLTYFWVGPVGYLRELPLLPVGGSTPATEELIGALQVSLSGTATLDVFGHKRTWELDWVCLTHAETAAVHSWFQGLTTATLRLVDPRVGNRVGRDAASGGSYHRDTRSHLPTAGTVAITTVTDYPTVFAGLVDGAVAWSVPASTATTLLIDSTDRVPLIPGEQITVTVWLKGTLNAQVGVQFYDNGGAAAGSTSATAVTLGAWAAYSVTVTPAGNQASGAVVVSVVSGAARTVTIGPVLGHPTNTDWVPGTGCPAVLPVERSITYPGLSRQDTGVTFREV